MTDPIIRGQNAKRAMDEFLAPAFEAVTAAYMDRLAQIAAAEPWATDKITKLAIAARVTAEVRNQIEALIGGGQVAQSAKDYAKKIEAIPVAKRRIMGLPIN